MTRRYYTARGHNRKVCQKIHHINDNWNHQLSREVADRYDLVYMEDLKIKNMTKSARGIKEYTGSWSWSP